MIRTVLIDDEQPARDRLRRMLAEHPDVSVVGEAGDASAAVELLDRERPDLCFLDVRMPGGDGFEVIARAAHLPIVVFTTAYEEYAVRAFEVRSIDYLLKPFARTRLAASLDRAREAIGRRGETPGDALQQILREIRAGLPAGSPEPPARLPAAPSRVTARRGAKIILLDPSEVAWFEADDTLVHARTGDGRFLVERSLADLEVLLSSTFFRIHRAYLVNLARVAEIIPGEAGTFRVIMRDEARTQLPLSRRQAQKLREVIPW